MSLVDELQKLEQLYQNGSLTAEEFSKAKTLLLSSLESANSSSDLPCTQGFVDKETQLKRLDFELETERQKFQTKRWEMLQPGMRWAVGLGLAVGMTAWYLVNGGLQQEKPILGQTQNIDLLQSGLEILTILLLIVTIWVCILYSKRMKETSIAYQTALKNYQEEREQILNS